jgi:hypothetical protein
VHGAASQKQLLGYAEVTGYFVRELIVEKKLILFVAIMFHLVRALFFSKKII